MIHFILFRTIHKLSYKPAKREKLIIVLMNSQTEQSFNKYNIFVFFRNFILKKENFSSTRVHPVENSMK